MVQSTHRGAAFQGSARFLFVIALLTACATQPLAVTHQPERLRIAACDACGPTAEDLAAAYREIRPWVTLEVEIFDTAVARQRLEAGAADLALLSWLGEDPSPLWSVPFATDAVAVIVHPAAPTEGLSRTELREIFRGRIGEWADGTPIQVVSREAGSGVRAVFEGAVMDGYAVTRAAMVVPDSLGMLQAVASTPGAIGYISLSQSQGNVHVVPIDGQWPNPSPSGGYLMAYPLFLTALSEPEGETRILAQWIVGPQGQQWVGRRLGPCP